MLVGPSSNPASCSRTKGWCLVMRGSTFCLGFLGLCKWASKIECAVAGGKEENVLLLRNMTENWEMWLNSWLGITSPLWDVGLQRGFFQARGWLWSVLAVFRSGRITDAVWGPSWPCSAPTLQWDPEWCAESRSAGNVWQKQPQLLISWFLVLLFFSEESVASPLPAAV